MSNEQKRGFNSTESKNNNIVILLLLVVGVGLLFVFVPQLLLACIVIGGFLYWWNVQDKKDASNSGRTKHYFSDSHVKRDKGRASKSNTGTIRTTAKEPTEQNQNLSRPAQFRCEKCGVQLFLTQPSNFHRQSHKFWCLKCYDQLKQDEAHVQKESEKQQANLPKSTKHEASKVPTMDDFMRPILEYAGQRSGSFGLREIADAMADHFNLSAEARNRLTRGGNIDRVYDRTSWSISHLRHAGFLRRTGRGRYEITDEGREEAKSSNEISVSYLMQNVPAYQRWKQSGTSREDHAAKRNEVEGEQATSEVPSMADFLRPILRWASEQPKEFTLREAADAMADHFNLSLKARDELTGEGNVDRVYDRTSWAISPHLKEAGLVHSVRRGHWKITTAGKEEAFASNERMTTTYLSDNFPAYRLWKENKRK